MCCPAAICTFRRPRESAAGTTLTWATRASRKALFDAYTSTHHMRFGRCISTVQPLLCSGLGMACRSTALPNTVLTRPGRCLCRSHAAAMLPTRPLGACPPPDDPMLYGLQPDDLPPKRVCMPCTGHQNCYRRQRRADVQDSPCGALCEGRPARAASERQ